MPSPQMNDIGFYLKPQVGVPPEALSAGAKNGAVVDRLGAYSALAIFQTGVDSGTPTSFTATCKIQHGDADDLSDAEDYDQAEPVVITAEDTLAKIPFNLERAKRYLRAVITVAFVDGTTPTLVCSSTIVLGGLDEMPAS